MAYNNLDTSLSGAEQRLSERSKNPTKWLTRMGLAFILFVGGGMAEELEDNLKPQAANPFIGVEFDHLKTEAKGKKHMKVQDVDCHLAKSKDFKATSPKGRSVKGRAIEWTDSLMWALEDLGIPTTKENVQLALILMHRESRMDTNPKMNVAPAFERKKNEMIARIKEHVPGETLQELLIGSVKDIFAKYEKEISEADTEVEVYNALIQIHNDFLWESELARKLIPYDPIDERIATLQDEMRVNTLGVLQVNPNMAIKYYAKEGRTLTQDTAVDYLYTLSANLKVGFAIFFTALEEYLSLGFSREEATKFAFADYNGGMYSSRNAAFQKMLGDISGQDLTTDGDLLIYEHAGVLDEGLIQGLEGGANRVSDRRSQTERALMTVFPELDARAQLLKEKAADFDDTDAFHLVIEAYRAKHERIRQSELALVPDADDAGAGEKYGREFSAGQYTKEAMGQVKAFKWKTCGR